MRSFNRQSLGTIFRKPHQMFSHVFAGITDFDCALAFYEPLMDVLGI